ncbi:sporulation membrane protein YtrI [Calidifontibacillus erzurumensis]|uniref:Sporulation protein n=1 Tax=Calidifontibacillus erzurumensis TaxID=2741433 RepID=A0A8J8GGC3_9BACI|nr:sporulation membrane protein YtrI [Calidifontibacillus erzurumensis]NSL51283.1 sporulation protein [Calidifontibacillus erzurumensis]
MRIPPFYLKQSWQRLLAGFFIGFLAGFLVFLFMYGHVQDKQVQLIMEQQAKIKQLEREKEIWQKDYEKLNEENKKKLIIEEINIYFTNEKKLMLNEFTKFNLQQAIKEDINTIIKKDIETVAENVKLLINTIENKTITLEEQNYRLKVEQLHLFTRLDLYLKIEIQ